MAIGPAGALVEEGRFSQGSFIMLNFQHKTAMSLCIEIDREEDGRWFAEIPDLPGVIVYGPSKKEAISKVKALALRVIAERIEYGEPVVDLEPIFPVNEKHEKTAS